MGERIAAARTWPCRGLVGAGALAAVALGGGCAKVAPLDRLQTCQTEEDCERGEFCNVAQGSVCQPLPDNLPSAGVLAVAITEDNDFQLELLGCELTESGTAFIVDRSDFTDTVGIVYTEWLELPNGVCFGDYEEHPDDENFGNVCEGQFPARVTMRQPSRLGRGSLSITGVYMMPIPEMEPSPAPVTFPWLHVPGNDGATLPEVQITIEDLRDIDTVGFERARVERLLQRDGTGPAAYEAEVELRARCHRRIDGQVARFGSGDPVAGATVSLTHAEHVAVPSTVLRGDAPPCTTDDQCAPGRACSQDAGVCGLDLEGQSAARTAISEEDGSTVSTVFSYCELTSSPDGRVYEVLAGPENAEVGLPTLRFDLDQPLEIGNAFDPLPRRDDMPGTMCLPDWGPAIQATFSASAAPLAILKLEDPGRTWRCCNDACLPVVEDLAEATPPEAPPSCTSFASIAFEAPVAPPANEEDWETAGCLPLAPDEDGFVGSYRSLVTPTAEGEETPDCEDGVCQAWLATGASGESLDYRVRIEQPTGSLFRSFRTTATLDDGALDLEDIEFEPRVVLQGSVECDEEIEGCTLGGATVFAERLRQSDEDPDDVLGPFFYSAQTLPDGSFYLPVNPGVYVVTARPGFNRPGGPTRYRILDLREDADGVREESDGLLRRIDPDPLVIEPGIPVRLRLDGFASETRVEPFDTGSWRAQRDPDWPTDAEGQPTVDLNLPSTCYGEAERGCRIRQLSIPVRRLPSGFAQFTVRARGSASCEP